MTENQTVERIYQLLVRFSLLGLVAAILVVIYITIKLFSRLETQAPAEMRLLLDLLKNRFFR